MEFENTCIYATFSDDDYREIEDYKYGYAAAYHLNKVCGYIDTNGYETLLFNYENIGSFCNNIAPVCRNNFWGFINRNFEEVVECKYIFLTCYNNFFIVREHIFNDFLVIDENGIEIFKSDDINKIYNILNKKENKKEVDSKILKKEYTIPFSGVKICTYEDIDGNRIIPYYNKENRNFSYGYVIVKVDRNNYKVFNEFGKQLKIHTCIKINAENCYLRDKINSFNFKTYKSSPDGYSLLLDDYVVFGKDREELIQNKNELIEYLNNVKIKNKRMD